MRQNPLRRRWPPAGHTTAAGSGGRRAPFSTDIASYTHAARSLACSAPILPRHFQVRWCACLPPPRVLLKHARGMDVFCNHNAEQLGSLAGLSLLTVYVVECAPASPYTYSSSTHRFPDERTPIEATPLSATSAKLGSGVGLGLGSHFSSHAPSHAPLLLATLLSHNMVGAKVLGNSSPRQILLEDHQVARQSAVVMVKGVCKTN